MVTLAEDCVPASVKRDLECFAFGDVMVFLFFLKRTLPLLIYLLKPFEEDALSMTLLHSTSSISLYLLLTSLPFSFFWEINLFATDLSSPFVHLIVSSLKFSRVLFHCSLFTPVQLILRAHIYFLYICWFLSLYLKHTHSVLILKKPSPDLRSSQDPALLSTSSLSKD